jgi:hypothetical protein
VLQYHDAWLAPHDQLAELSQIGARFAGASPALMTEYQPYGVRHMLRNLAPEGASELRVRPVALRSGGTLARGLFANLDDFDLDAILTYRTLVLRRSPIDSRPPAVYRLVSSGLWYDVWQRPEPLTTRVLEHLPLGGDASPGAVPDCNAVLRLARLAGTTRVATVERAPVVTVPLSTVPAGWGADQSGVVFPAGAGTVEASVDVPVAGRYQLWLGGSFRDRLQVLVDGKPAGSRRDQLNNSGQYTQIGEADLVNGTHTVTLRYGGPDLHPGSGGPHFGFGPLVLARQTAALPVRYVRPARARSLCGQTLDWVEALGP